MQWLINNIENAYHHLVTLNPVIEINTDGSLSVHDIKYSKHPFGGLWQKLEIGHINVVELITIEIGDGIYCFFKKITL